MSRDWIQIATDWCRPRSWTVIPIAFIFAVTTGTVAAIAASKHDWPFLAFVCVGGLVGGYLWRQGSGYSALSTGLYSTAVVVFNFPIVYFVPGAGSRTVEVIGTGNVSIGAAYALAVWAPVFTIIAGLLFGGGYLFSQRVDGTSSLEGSSHRAGYRTGEES